VRNADVREKASAAENAEKAEVSEDSVKTDGMVAQETLSVVAIVLTAVMITLSILQALMDSFTFN
jgi:hypothetical protein